VPIRGSAFGGLSIPSTSAFPGRGVDPRRWASNESSRALPHSSTRSPGVTPAEHRYRMIRAAVDKEPGFESSRVEVDREGPSYTIDTLAVIKRSFPGTEVFLSPGSTRFRTFEAGSVGKSPRSYPFVVHTVPVWTGGRLGSCSESMRSGWFRSRRLPPRSRHHRHLSDPDPDTRHLVDRDSCLVRAGVDPFCYLVPREVENYITEHRLYREGA
jgi:nicotinate-nucleotide adenylyltransferase